MRALTIGLLILAAACSRAPARPVATALDGTAISSEMLQRKLVLVNFWATWCKPCREEMPALQAVYRRHADNGLVILGLVSSDPASDEEVRRIAGSWGVTYPLARATPELETRYGLGAMLPTSVLYDRAGRVHRRWDGIVEEDELEETIRALLAR